MGRFKWLSTFAMRLFYANELLSSIVEYGGDLQRAQFEGSLHSDVTAFVDGVGPLSGYDMAWDYMTTSDHESIVTTEDAVRIHTPLNPWLVRPPQVYRGTPKTLRRSDWPQYANLIYENPSTFAPTFKAILQTHAPTFLRASKTIMYNATMALPKDQLVFEAIQSFRVQRQNRTETHALTLVLNYHPGDPRPHSFYMATDPGFWDMGASSNLREQCTRIQSACVGENQQYAHHADCMARLGTLPRWNEKCVEHLMGNSTACRDKHLAIAERGGVYAEVHCPHVSMGGGGKCRDSQCDEAVLGPLRAAANPIHWDVVDRVHDFQSKTCPLEACINGDVPKDPVVTWRRLLAPFKASIAFSPAQAAVLRQDDVDVHLLLIGKVLHRRRFVDCVREERRPASVRVLAAMHHALHQMFGRKGAWRKVGLDEPVDETTLSDMETLAQRYDSLSPVAFQIDFAREDVRIHRETALRMRDPCYNEFVPKHYAMDAKTLCNRPGCEIDWDRYVAALNASYECTHKSKLTVVGSLAKGLERQIKVPSARFGDEC